MLFTLKKFTAFWLMPLPFCLTLIVGGLLLEWLWRKRPKVGHTLVIIGAAALFLFSNKLVSNWLILPLESKYPSQPELKAGVPPPAGLQACQYVVVLGGGHNDLLGPAATNKLSTSALARIVEGVRLARALPQATLIVSGPAGPVGVTHASILSRAAIALGMDPKRIVQVDTARDTEEESLAVRSRVGDGPVALVTSAWHMPRAAALFRKAGVTILPCPTDYLGRVGAKGFHPEDWTWDTESLERSTFAVRERLGYLWISLRGKTS